MYLRAYLELCLRAFCELTQDGMLMKAGSVIESVLRSVLESVL